MEWNDSKGTDVGEEPSCSTEINEGDDTANTTEPIPPVNGAASMKNDESAFAVVEIWQSQSYWPIHGWSAPSMTGPSPTPSSGGTPSSGNTHFSGSIVPHGPAGSHAEKFPDHLPAPHGWQWHSVVWSIDNHRPNRYGQPDSEGWFYGISFDRLNEAIRGGGASGVASKTSIVRKRRWTRNVRCVSAEILQQIRSRTEKIIKMRSYIEQSLKDKERVILALRVYEANRMKVFSQSLHIVTQGTLNTLNIIKETGSKLRKIRQFLFERAALEREYSLKLEALGRKCILSNLPPPNAAADSSTGDGLPYASPIGHTMETTRKSPSMEELEVMIASSSGEVPGAPPSTTTSPTAAAIRSPGITGNTVKLDSAKVLFASLGFTSYSTATRVREFSNNLSDILTRDIDQLGVEVQQALKEARNIFRKNSDICRLSESAVSNCAKSVQCIYDSVTAAYIAEIARLSEELNALKGSEEDRSPMSHDISSSSSSSSVSAGHLIASLETEDLWLGVQRYRQAVRDSQESLCILLSEEMDLQLQQQILSNKVHSLFVNIAKAYASDQNTLLLEAHSFLKEVLDETVANMVSGGIPHPVLQSPFARFQQIQLQTKQFNKLSLSPSSSPSSDSNQKDYQPSSEDILSDFGAFAFTRLFDSPLPPCPGIIISGEMYVASSEYFRLNNVAKYKHSKGNSSPPKGSTTNNHSNGDYVHALSTSSAESTLEENGGKAIDDGGVLRFDLDEELDSDDDDDVCVWKPVFVVATADKYLHILGRRNLHGMPRKSFNLQICDVLSVAKGLLDDDDRFVSVLEIRPNISLTRGKSPAPKGIARKAPEGIFLRTADTSPESEELIRKWVAILTNPFERSASMYVDSAVEAANLEAMRKPIAILRGETSKMTMAVLEQEAQLRSRAAGFAAANLTEGEQPDTGSSSPALSPSQPPAKESVSKKSDQLVADSDDEEEEEDEDGNHSHSTEQPVEQPAPTDTTSGLSVENFAGKVQEALGVSPDKVREAIVNKFKMTASAAPPIVMPFRGGLFGFEPAQQYQKKKDSNSTTETSSSWQSSSATNSSASNATVASSDVAKRLPQRIIPKSDKSIPLAKRHSLMIEQYQKGLEEDLERERKRISEQRRHRNLDVQQPQDEILSSNSSDFTSLGRSEDSDTGRPMVKQLSKRFSFANSTNTTTTNSVSGNTMGSSLTSKRGSPQPDGEVQL